MLLFLIVLFFLNKQHTVKYSWYPIICLSRSIWKIEENPVEEKHIIFLSEYASTSPSLCFKNLNLIGHPSYTPDSSPNDFLLLLLKKLLMRSKCNEKSIAFILRKTIKRTCVFLPVQFLFCATSCDLQPKPVEKKF